MWQSEVPPVEAPSTEQIDSNTAAVEEPESPAIDLTGAATGTADTVTPSEAEAQLAAEADKAKNQLLDEIK